ncbi:MAG: hypothetical protein ACRDL5_15520, partial [Solirubrobacteraceae bacterium]
MGTTKLGAKMSERRYEPRQIEAKWQAVWADERTWEVDNRPAPSSPGEVAAGRGSHPPATRPPASTTRT